MRDYDKPTTPANTPPVIDPEAKPKTSAEMEAEDESEGEVSDHHIEEDEIEVERALSAAQEDGRDGAGESALDNSDSD